MRRPNLRAPLSRREFVKLAMSTAAVAAAGGACDWVRLDIPDYPFRLGVASGDPLHDRVVIWTRLCPDPLAPDGHGGMLDLPVSVGWEVATDENFNSIVRSGVAVAHHELAHSVHVDVTGLQSNSWYYYRFFAGDHVSPVGRTRTFPAPGALASQFRFASASCQHWPSGFWTAYEAMSQEDLDFVVHLGDYIYESGGNGPVRVHVGGRVQDLAGYRNRYALYKGDRHLQATHLLCPWIVTWDDHEVANNYAGDLFDENATPPSIPFLELRAAAYQAWYEHHPVRLLPPQPTGLRIYRGFDFGDLARILVLDTRQYRSNQPCGDSIQPACPGFPNPQDTMLGSQQEAWLFDGLTTSEATWNVLAQQVVFAPTPLLGLFNMDQWDGYPVARQRILDCFQGASVSNPVILTGDIHAAGAGWVPADTTGLTNPIATELVATGISSRFPAELAPIAESVIGGLPHVSFFEARTRGYLLHHVTPDVWVADFRFVTTTARPTANVFTGATFAVEPGQPVPQQA